jgi:uncharacterized protein (DUF4415 family)
MKKKYRGTVEEDNIEELPDEFFKNAKYGLDGLAEIIGEEAVAPLRKMGRPKSAAPKQNGTLRLAADVWTRIKASGRGYNGRVERALRQALEDGRI